MLCEKEQQLELTCGEVCFAPVDKDAMRPRLNLERVEAQDRGRHLGAALETIVARDVRLNACGEFARLKGLTM